MTLRNALLILSYPLKIISEKCATDQGATVTFEWNQAMVAAKNGTIFPILPSGQLYYLPNISSLSDVLENIVHAKNSIDLNVWNKILRHCNASTS